MSFRRNVRLGKCHSGNRRSGKCLRETDLLRKVRRGTVLEPSGELMTLKALNKINGKLKFLYRKNTNTKHQHYAEYHLKLSSSRIFIIPTLRGTLISMKK